MVLTFSLLRPETFATVANVRTIFLESSVLAILAMAAMVPLIAKDFDLSIASVLGFVSLLAVGLPTRQELPVPVALVACLAVGVVIGLVHALLIVRWELPSVVVTLGTGTILTGLSLWYSGGTVIYEGVPEQLTRLGNAEVLGIRLPVFYMAAVALILWFVLEKRPWGRYLYATGASEITARLAGVDTAKARAAALVVASSLAALAGIVLSARLGSGSPTIANDFFLPAFAGAFLSIAAFKLGFFNPLGVICAVYLLATGVNGLSMLGAPAWVEHVFNGLALVVAVGLAHVSSGTARTMHKGRN
nr:ABC transporter permease [Phytoactinopolyspora alkaliphila]